MTRRKAIDDDPPPSLVAAARPAAETRFGRHTWLLALVLVMATLVAYQPTWHAGFIWDDDDHVTANWAMTAPHGLRMIWSSLAVSRYYPLTLTCFWVQRRLWGLNPLPYHLVNVTLHAMNGVLVFLLLRRLRVRGAWLAATLWALHPVNVESVAWITELKNTQSGLFFFVAVWCFLRFDTRAGRGWYGLALLCGLAAVLSKPSTVVLPVALLLCIWWERGSWRRADILRVVPFFVLALGMSALTILEQRGHIQRAGPAEWNLGMAERFIVAGRAVWFYAAKIFWPARLAFVYPRWELEAGSFWNWLPLTGLVLGGVLVWAWRRQGWGRAVLFGCGFFVLSLLPVLGFFDVFYFQYSFVADHFQYLASLGLISLTAAAAAVIGERAGRRGRDWGTVVSTIVVVILGACTWRQAHVYRDVETLWRDTLTKNPRCWLAESNLGMALESAGREQEAIAHCEEALRIKPDCAAAHNNLGLALVSLGREREAVGHFEEALRIKPDYAEVRYNLGNVLLSEGEVEEAVEQFKQAARTKPDYVDAYNNWGVALMQQGNAQGAIRCYQQVLQIRPDYAEAHYNLGLALVRAGRLEEAVEHWEQAVQIRPDYWEAQYALGVAFERAGRVLEAIGYYEQVLRINPGFRPAQQALTRLRARP